MKHAGYTLVELVCTIVIVSVLAAVSIPRLIDFADDAYRANVDGTASAFASAVQFVKLIYVVRDRTGNVDNLPGFGDGAVDTNANGYPTDTANANTIPNNATGATRCRNVFLGVLQAPAPICGGSVACTGAHYYQAVTTAAQTCRFNFIMDPSPPRFFLYSAATGSVTVNNP
jgi:prepilin-type N-terminal cleavage/methylation domain-containing protein